MINSSYPRGEVFFVLNVLDILPIQCCLKFTINVQILLLIKTTKKNKTIKIPYLAEDTKGIDLFILKSLLITNYFKSSQVAMLVQR